MTAQNVMLGASGGGGLRFYKLSKPVHQFTNNLSSIEEELKYVRNNLNENYKCLVPEGAKCWDAVCISDAYTHSERLLFLACEVEPGVFFRLNTLHLDGKMTMLSQGGDSDTIEPDEEYLRRLAEANGFSFGGIKQAPRG